MKNIPVFTGENGIATLILREIPHSGRAYVMIRSVWGNRTEAFLTECRQFCRAAGAGEVCASWDLEPLPAPHVYDMLTMECEKAALPAARRPVELVPLSPENSGVYLEIYNRCFRDVYGAASYDAATLQPLYGEETAWLTRAEGTWAGVAEISRRGLESVAVLPDFRGQGLGRDLTLSVLDMVPRKTIALSVCSLNAPAIRLYGQLGFRQTAVVSRWWRLEK